MFKKPLLIAACLLLLIASAIGVGLFQSKQKAKATYQHLIESSLGSKQENVTFSSQQMRKDVCKELFLRETDPRHIRIESKASELFFFDHRRKGIEVREEMRDVHCVMQEELFFVLPDGSEAIKMADGKCVMRGHSSTQIDPTMPGMIPMQLIRYFEAQNATYFYNSERLTAHTVKLWKYRMKGHQIPSSFEREIPLMSGVADSVELYLKEDEMQFTAHHLKAVFDAKRGTI